MGSGSSPGGGTTHPGGPKDLGGGAPSRWGQPKAVLRKSERKPKEEKEKKRERWKRREGLHLPILVGLGLEEDSSSPWSRSPWGFIEPQGKPPLPPPIYMEQLGLI